MEKTVQTRSISERSEFIKDKERDNANTASRADHSSDRQGEPTLRTLVQLKGRIDAFHGLLASFYSLKIKKIPAEGWMIDYGVIK